MCVFVSVVAFLSSKNTSIFNFDGSCCMNMKIGLDLICSLGRPQVKRSRLFLEYSEKNKILQKLEYLQKTSF